MLLLIVCGVILGIAAYLGGGWGFVIGLAALAVLYWLGTKYPKTILGKVVKFLIASGHKQADGLKSSDPEANLAQAIRDDQQVIDAVATEAGNNRGDITTFREEVAAKERSVNGLKIVAENAKAEWLKDQTNDGLKTKAKTAHTMYTTHNTLLESMRVQLKNMETADKKITVKITDKQTEVTVARIGGEAALTENKNAALEERITGMGTDSLNGAGATGEVVKGIKKDTNRTKGRLSMGEDLQASNPDAILAEADKAVAAAEADKWLLEGTPTEAPK